MTFSHFTQQTRQLGKRGVHGVELFGTFNDAMAYEFLLRIRKNEKHILVMLGTENTYLRAWFRSQKIEISLMFSVLGFEVWRSFARRKI